MNEWYPLVRKHKSEHNLNWPQFALQLGVNERALRDKNHQPSARIVAKLREFLGGQPIPTESRVQPSIFKSENRENAVDQTPSSKKTSAQEVKPEMSKESEQPSQTVGKNGSYPITVFDKSFTSPGQDILSVEKVIEGKQTDEANFSEGPPSNRGATDFPAGLAGDEVMAGQLPRKFLKKGERYEERPIVVSLLRTKCPFCEHDVDRLRNCVYCGQHFAWANIPMEPDKPL